MKLINLLFHLDHGNKIMKSHLATIWWDFEWNQSLALDLQ